MADDDRPTAMVKAAAALLGAAVGGVIHGPEGATAGAVAPVVIEYWATGARARVADLFAQAAAADGLSADAFALLVTEDEQNAALFVQTAEAAWWTIHQPKLRALTAVLADGVRDEARVDAALLFAQAFRQLERPHLEVLRVLVDAVPFAPDGYARPVPAVTPEQLSDRLPYGPAAVAGVVGVLNATGCVTESGGAHAIRGETVLRPTPFGRALLDWVLAGGQE